MSRLYQITLIFLAPLCVIGGMAFIRSIIKHAGISWTDRKKTISIKILTIYFAIFLLYQSGFVFGLTEGISNPLQVYNSSIDFPRFNDREVSGAMWWLRNTDANKTTFADDYRILLLGSFAWDQITDLKSDASYTYLGTFNIMNGSIIRQSKGKMIIKNFYSRYSSLIDTENNIYFNGGASVYYK